jgi:hypothetical protein
MFTAPLFEQVPKLTLDELRKMRDAKLAVAAWRHKQTKLRDKGLRHRLSSPQDLR